MRCVRALSCALLVACSPDDVEPTGSEPPVEPEPPPHDDTDEPPPEKPDCDLVGDAVVTELPWFEGLELDWVMSRYRLPTDFGDQGTMLAMRYEDGFPDRGDIVGFQADGTELSLVERPESDQIWYPRALANGRIAYLGDDLQDDYVAVFDPVEGVRAAAASVPNMYLLQLEVHPNGTTYVLGRSMPGDAWSIQWVDPYDVLLRVVASEAGWGHLVSHVFHIALSADGEDVYASTTRAHGGGNGMAIHAFKRQVTGKWGDPAAVVTSGDVHIAWTSPLALDACDNVYFLGDSDPSRLDVWRFDAGSGTTQVVAELPLLDITAGVRLFWGSGRGDAKATALHAVGIDEVTRAPRRFEIDLGVPGTHVLAP